MGGRQHSRQGMTIANFNKENMDRIRLLRRSTNAKLDGLSKTFIVVDLTLFQPYMSLGYPEVTRERVLCKWR